MSFCSKPIDCSPYLPLFFFEKTDKPSKIDLIAVCMTFIKKRTWMIEFCVLTIGITPLCFNSPTAEIYQS